MTARHWVAAVRRAHVIIVAIFGGPVADTEDASVIEGACITIIALASDHLIAASTRGVAGVLGAWAVVIAGQP